MSTDGKPTVQMGPSIEQIKEASKKASAAQSRRLITNTIGSNQPPSGAPLMQGVGSGFTANQEVSTKTQLSDATMEGLKELHEQTAQQASLAEQKEQMITEKEESKAQREVQDMAGIGQLEPVGGLMEAVASNPFLREDVRKHIEVTLEPIDMTKLIMGRGTQRVQINDTISVVFQTISVKEDLIIKQIMRHYVDETVAFYEDTKLALNLAVGLVQINDTALPSLENEAGQVTDRTIKERYASIANMPVQLLSWMAINYIWFDLRIRKQLLPSNLKNG